MSKKYIRQKKWRLGFTQIQSRGLGLQGGRNPLGIRIKKKHEKSFYQCWIIDLNGIFGIVYWSQAIK